MVTTLTIVRHGETDWNRDRRIQGQTDIPLNAAGLVQAGELRDRLEGVGFEAVYASDLERAWRTAAMVAEPRGLAVRRRPALREKDFGTWEGLTDSEVLTRFPDARRGSWGDGETAEALASRVLAAVDEIVAAHAGGSVLVVSHGGAIRALYRHAGIEPGPIGNCVPATFVADGEDLALTECDEQGEHRG